MKCLRRSVAGASHHYGFISRPSCFHVRVFLRKSKVKISSMDQRKATQQPMFALTGQRRHILRLHEVSRIFQVFCSNFRPYSLILYEALPDALLCTIIDGRSVIVRRISGWTSRSISHYLTK